MTKPTTLQSVLKQFYVGYRQHHRISPVQAKVCNLIQVCRTERLGGQRLRCNECGYEQHRYHSCRNRHCPKCQHQASQRWCAQQEAHLLPVTYYHVVFTLPHSLNPWVQCHPEVIYQCLFHAVWNTLKQFGSDRKRLNGQIGMTAILHTWGSNLSQHVHLHCLLPGGALSNDQRHWHGAKSNYLFPVKALSKHFRGKMVSILRQAQQDGKLARLAKEQVDEKLNALMRLDWVVYSKAYLHQAKTIVQYLARYTHKIALSDSRLIGCDHDQVLLRYKDYRKNQTQVMSLHGEELIRRFLLHVLPSGLMRVRHYGFLSNRARRKQLKIISECLQKPKTEKNNDTKETILEPFPCPKCQVGFMQQCGELTPRPLLER